MNQAFVRRPWQHPGTSTSTSGAAVSVHGAARFIAASGGYEYVLLQAAVALFFTLAGSGLWSADRVIASPKPGYLHALICSTRADSTAPAPWREPGDRGDTGCVA